MPQIKDFETKNINVAVLQLDNLQLNKSPAFFAVRLFRQIRLWKHVNSSGISTVQPT